MSDKLTGFIRLKPSAHVSLVLQKTNFIKQEWVDEGRADEKGCFLYNNDERNVQVGFWQCTPFKETITFPYDELGIVLSGRLELAGPEGNSDTFSPGEIFFIPRGATTTWHILEDFKQYYMIYAPRDAQYYQF